MLQGLTTVNLISDDVPATVAWYTELLGVQPYFVRPEQGPPAYVEFRLGPDEDELGILDSRFAKHPATRHPCRRGGLLACRRRRGCSGPGRCARCDRA